MKDVKFLLGDNNMERKIAKRRDGFSERYATDRLLVKKTVNYLFELKDEEKNEK